MYVSLTVDEMRLAAQAGVERQLENTNRKPRYGAGSSRDWQLHIEGCMGELALAKALGISWAGKGVFQGPDVGEYEVRTSSKDGSSLILHPSDPDESLFWLVLGTNGNYRVAGHILGKHGKQDEYWRDDHWVRHPAYFVPQSALS